MRSHDPFPDLAELLMADLCGKAGPGGPIDLSPAELKAIEEHKYHLSRRRHREVEIEEAIFDFVMHYQNDWKRWKQRQDNRAQAQLVELHQFLASARTGAVVDMAAAAADWRAKYAEVWRTERESLERNEFLSVTVTVANPRGLHMRPCSAVAALARRFDCDVYVSRPGMDVYNFTLNGKPYLNVRSVLGLLTMAAVQGDELELIAHGRQAREALDALAGFIRNPQAGLPAG